MRNFRKAALSGMTALALLTSGTTVAFAEDSAPQHSAPGFDQERPDVAQDASRCDNNLDLTKVQEGNPDCNTNSLVDDLSNGNNSSNSSVWGKRYNGDRDVTGRDLLGFEKNFGNIPVWAEIWYVVTILGVIGSAVGLLSLPVVNEAKNLGILR